MKVPSGDTLGDNSPLVPMEFVELKKSFLFLFAPDLLLYFRVEVIVPSK